MRKTHFEKQYIWYNDALLM